MMNQPASPVDDEEDLTMAIICGTGDQPATLHALSVWQASIAGLVKQ
jgi:hypothetical protein